MHRREQPLEIGARYLELRDQGNAAKKCCDRVREEFQKPTLTDATIRSYASEARRGQFFPRQPKEPREPVGTTRKIFKLLNDLANSFDLECRDKRLSGSDLMNVILMQRYKRPKKIKA